MVISSELFANLVYTRASISGGPSEFDIWYLWKFSPFIPIAVKLLQCQHLPSDSIGYATGRKLVISNNAAFLVRRLTALNV